jgi:hypothetical protein
MSDDATLTAAVVPPAEAPRTDAWSRRFSTIGAMFVTAMIFLLFAACMAVAYLWEDKQAFNGLSETVKALVMVAAGFWIGSSSGSKQQSEVIAAKLAQPDPQAQVRIEAGR